MADIESMFHQVRVPEHDSSFLRFLWWDDGNLAGEVQEYQMLSSFPICRSVLPEAFGPVVSSQLHHFSDASEAAYGSVSYLRLVDDEGRVHFVPFCKVSTCTSEIRFYSSFGALRCYFICPP